MIIDKKPYYTNCYFVFNKKKMDFILTKIIILRIFYK